MGPELRPAKNRLTCLPVELKAQVPCHSVHSLDVPDDHPAQVMSCRGEGRRGKERGGEGRRGKEREGEGEKK